MSATAHFITVTAADHKGDVSLHARSTSDLPGDGILNAVGCLLMAELKKGTIDPKRGADARRRHERRLTRSAGALGAT